MVSFSELRIKSWLGAGQFANVYLVKQLNGDLAVIKLLKYELRNDETARNDIATEILYLSNLNATIARIPKVLGQGETKNGRPFFVLERLACSLDSLLPDPNDNSVTPRTMA